MKRNLSTKSIAVSVALSAMLAGCGSSTISDDKTDGAGNSNNNTAKTISGKAVDGYLQFATVCLDISQDGYCQADEPMTTTDKEGAFSLNITAEIEANEAFSEAMLLVYGGKDADSGSDFKGKLLAPQDAHTVNISPITTLIAKAVQKEFKADKKLNKEEVKAKIDASKEKFAKVFNIPEADLLKDPVAQTLTNPKLIKEALKIQKMVEALSQDKSNDKLEEMYERLADSLDKIADSQGLDALLDEAFKGEEAQLAKSRAVSKNIDTMFIKFKDDIDLRKIATMIKEDLRKVADGETIAQINLDDERFAYDAAAWEDEYIKSDLKDIGVSLPTQAQIAQIKESISETIVPGIVFEKEKEFKDKQEQIFKDISAQIKKEKAKQEVKKEAEKAKYEAKRVKFEKGMTLFDFDTEGYEKIEIGSDNVISITRYDLSNGVFTQAQEDNKSSARGEYKLNNGVWEVLNNDKKAIAYTLEESGVLKLPEIGGEAFLVNQKDLSNKEIYLDTLDTFVTMPEGAKVSYVGFKQREDVYTLNNQVGDFMNLSSYVAQQCESGEFINKDGSTCSATDTKGKTPNRGEWQIKTVDGIEILTLKNRWSKDEFETIYALYNGMLYSGDYEKAGRENSLDANYNSVAIEAIKAIMINANTQDTKEVVTTPRPQ